MRLQIHPALPLTWRDPGSVQIGLGDGAVVLSGLTGREPSLVRRLDGSLDRSAWLGEAERAGVSRERAEQLIGLLDRAGLLLVAATDRAHLSEVSLQARDRLRGDAACWGLLRATGPDDGGPTLLTRARAAVRLTGGGRTVLALALTLAAAGVGLLLVDRDREGDHVDALRRAAQAVAPGVRVVPTGALAEPRPAIAVLTGGPGADLGAGVALMRDDVPHLAVQVRPTAAVVGPLVLPGRTPCLRCLDLHRTDRDPAWPSQLAQLSRCGEALAPALEEISLSAAAAGLAAVQVLAHLDGHAPAATGATLELGLPDGLPHRRAWPGHPSCGCSWPPQLPVSPRRPAVPAMMGA